MQFNFFSMINVTWHPVRLTVCPIWVDLHLFFKSVLSTLSKWLLWQYNFHMALMAFCKKLDKRYLILYVIYTGLKSQLLQIITSITIPCWQHTSTEVIVFDEELKKKNHTFYYGFILTFYFEISNKFFLSVNSRPVLVKKDFYSK